MKKILNFLSISILCFIITGCKNEKSNFDNYDILPGPENYAYTFTATNPYFIIHKGLADYRDDNSIFSLEDLECLDSNLEYEYVVISVSFQEGFWGLVTIQKEDLLQKRQNIMSEKGKKIKRAKDGKYYGEISSFMRTSPKDLPTSIKIISKICQKDDTCKEVAFETNFQKIE